MERGKVSIPLGKEHESLHESLLQPRSGGDSCRCYMQAGHQPGRELGSVCTAAPEPKSSPSLHPPKPHRRCPAGNLRLMHPRFPPTGLKGERAYTERKQVLTREHNLTPSTPKRYFRAHQSLFSVAIYTTNMPLLGVSDEMLRLCARRHNLSCRSRRVGLPWSTQHLRRSVQAEKPRTLPSSPLRPPPPSLEPLPHLAC